MRMRTIRMCVVVTAVLALTSAAGAADAPPAAPPVELEQLAGKPAPGGGVWKKVDVVIEWGFQKGTDRRQP